MMIEMRDDTMEVVDEVGAVSASKKRTREETAGGSAVRHGSLVDCPSYWCDASSGYAGREFEPPHHLLWASIDKAWEEARETDPRLAYGKLQGSLSGCSMTGVSHVSTKFTDPETFLEVEFGVRVMGGNSYAFCTAQAAVHQEVLRRFDVPVGAAEAPSSFKDTAEQIAQKRQVERDWRMVLRDLHSSPEGEEFARLRGGYEQPTPEHVIAHPRLTEQRAALVCHVHLPHAYDYPVWGDTMTRLCGVYPNHP